MATTDLGLLTILTVLLDHLGLGQRKEAGVRGIGHKLTGRARRIERIAAKAESCLASSLSEDAKSMIISSIPQGATVSVEGMDQSMTETTAKVKASLSKGGEQEYTVKFVRSDNHIGWAVSSLDMDFSAADNQ